MWILILAITLVYLYFWYQKSYGHRNKLLEKFPAPKSYPILNHGYLFVGKSPYEIFKQLTEFSSYFESLWRIDLTPFTTFIIVQDAEIVEKILTSQKLIDKPDDYSFMSNWLGTGLLLSSGSKWHQRRKLITPTFHFKILEQFIEIMDKHGDIFVEKLRKLNGQTIDVFPLVSFYSLDVICESAMGYQLNAQHENSEYAECVKEITKIAYLKIYDPSKRIPSLYRLSKLYKHEQELIKTLHAFTDSVIESRREILNKHNDNERPLDSENELGIKKKTALLDLLLQVKVDGKGLSVEDIREEVDTFTFAGHDTTTSAISFILLALAKYQDIQQKVYEEVETVLGNNISHSMQNLNKLNYLEKVIKESLRVYPPAPLFARKFLENETINGYVFPANVNVRISTYFMGRNPKYFPDPSKFDPSRFDSEENNIQIFSYIPFSAGPRNCIGQKYAMLEIKSVVSKLIHNFKIIVKKEDENPKCKVEIILRPVDGINLSFESRK